MIRKTGLVLSAAACALWTVCLLSATAAAAEGGEGDQEALRREAMGLMRKRREGVELTEEERRRLRDIREQMPPRKGREGREGREGRQGGEGRDGRRRGEGDRRRPGGRERPAGPAHGNPLEKLNVLDQAAFAVAGALAKAERHKEAAGHLLYVVANSPDAEAKSLAHLKLGELYGKHLDDPGKSKSHYLRVGGELSDQARGAVIGPLVKEEKFDEAIEALVGFAKEAPDAVATSGAVRMMVEVAVRSGDPDRMVKTIGTARELLTYAEAQKAAKELAELRKKRAAERPPRGGGFGQGNRPGGEMGPEERMRAMGRKLGEAGPEVIERLRERVRMLEEGGQAERAERLKRILERIQMHQGGGGAPEPDRVPAPRGRPADGEIF